jgi:monoamine oxidase
VNGCDLVVVGAGAAGLAAARRARDLGLSATVLEAKDRIGGRAWTDATSLGIPWDRGANWLHDAERNLFRRYADEEGFAHELGPAERQLWSGGRFDPALRAALDDHGAAAFAAVAAAGAAGQDIPAARVIPPQPRLAHLFAPWFAALNGIEAERMSTLDFARAALDGGNWRVEDGYGALLGHYGRGIPVELGTPARRIAWGGRTVQVDTARGRLEAACAIVTVSTNVLASGRIGFDPPLPADRQDALAAIPTGHAAKVALAFAHNVFALDAPCFLRIDHPVHAAFIFELRPFGRDLAIGHLAAHWAAEAEAAGPDAMAEQAVAALAQVFGSGLRNALRAVATTAWSSDPDILGAYSCALAGQAHLRPRLAEPLGERLLFAGEACSLHAYGTAHGAAETGIAAAEAVARVLGRAPAACQAQTISMP